MIRINDTLVSEDLIEHKFVCDLNACKGMCCVAGESGAPVDENEIDLLAKAFEISKPYLSEESIKRIEEVGTSVIDSDGDLGTPLMGQGRECAYVVYDEKKVAKCGLEMAWRDGKSDWMKPVSCHLYPIRIKELKDFSAVNLHRWDICQAADVCGSKLNVPVYRFLKDGLVRRFGEDWFEAMTVAEKELTGEGNSEFRIQDSE